ncbi:MAG: DivIVA domain-containing protein [Brachybacterium tyrofermentans]
MKITFTLRTFSEAYDVEAVDEFIDRLEQALLRGDGALGVEDVRAVVFEPVRFRAGYDMAEVDDFLDGVAIQLLEGRMAYDPAHDYSPQGPQSSPRHEMPGSRPAEPRGFFARLFGGNR